VSVWIFINLVFVGMCGYIYLLWSQYWQYVERQHEHMAGLISSAGSSGGGSSQIFYYYNRDSYPSTTDPDVIAVSSKNRSNAVSKQRSNDRPGNRTSVWRKYMSAVVQMPQNFTGYVNCNDLTPRLYGIPPRSSFHVVEYTEPPAMLKAGLHVLEYF